MRAYLVASVVFAFGGAAALAQQAAVSPIGQPMQPEASPRSETGVPAIEATPGASAPFSASANPILHVPVSGLHPGNVSFAPRIANPLADDPQAAMRGMRDFIQFNCVGCHAPNAGGGMGPALSEGRFIYGSSPANLFLSIYQGRPNGMPTWGALLPEFDDLGACLLRAEHRPSAERDLWTNDLANAALASRRANAGRISANAEAVEFHEPLQRRAPASGRVIGDGLCEAHNRFDRALCGRRACLSRSRVSDGYPARRRSDGEENSAFDAGSVDRLRRRRRHHHGAGPDRRVPARARRRRCGHSAPGNPGRRVDPNRRRPFHDRAGRPGCLDFHDDG